MQIGRRIYYEILTGNILVDTGERQGFVRETSVDDDIENYKVLSERNRETFDFVELEFGQYRQDFMECSGYRVNPDTLKLEFSYPDPNEEEPQEPVYQKSLSEEVEELRQIIDTLIGGEDIE